ncbi:hypothetical protein BJX99DRAFT_257460 [Aspergillus californicus]
MGVAIKAAECSRRLEGILQAAASDDSRQDWENHIFRFNLWSENNFVFAPTRASMDWRLRNAALLESSVCELLDDLQSSLIRYAAVMQQARYREQADQHGAVGETLEELFRLSRAIRRSGILRRFVKVGSYVEYDEYGVNLTDEFRKGVERIIDFRLKGSRASHDLQQRVVDTICLRQQHFAYLRAKWEKGKPTSSVEIAAPALSRSTLGATFSVTGPVSLTASKTRKKELVTVRQVASVMTATTAQPDRMKRARSIKSAISVADAEVECNQEALPLPPKVPLNAVEHECPFCYMVCPLEDLSGDRWKKHVIQDIMPYFCVLEECPTPNTLFESGLGWLKHMKTQHVVTSWTCMDDSHDTTLFFDSDSAFKDHMHACHIHAFPEDELDEIAAASYQQLPVDNVITNCPFCSPDVDINLPSENIINHLAEHLVSLAQISISWQMDGEGNESHSSRATSLSDDIHTRSYDYTVEWNGRPVRVKAGRPYTYKDLERVHIYGTPSLDLAIRKHRDFPSLEDEDYATDQEYHRGDHAEIQDIDGIYCHSMWQEVRQELYLPPLDHHPPDSLSRFQWQEGSRDEAETKRSAPQADSTIHNVQPVQANPTTDYYFSVDNLCKDIFLRKHMDSQGFVPLNFIASFKRIKHLTEDFELLRLVSPQLKIAEYYVGEDGVDRLRPRTGWEQWTLIGSHGRHSIGSNEVIMVVWTRNYLGDLVEVVMADEISITILCSAARDEATLSSLVPG